MHFVMEELTHNFTKNTNKTGLSEWKTDKKDNLTFLLILFEIDMFKS